MDLYAYLARPSRLGLVITFGAGLVVLILCLAFESIVPNSGAYSGKYLGQQNLNFRSIILYATTGGTHILLCASSIIFFSTQLRRGQPKPEFKRVIVATAISFVVIFGVVLIACNLDLNLVHQSFQGRMAPIQNDARFSLLLGTTVTPLLNLKLQIFALFPLLLIAFGIIAAVIACFWIADKAVTFAYAADSLSKKEIVQLKRSVAQLVALISIVFTTSALATITLMQIGRDRIEKGDAREAYIQNGDAMSIFWSACYTSIIATIVLIPLWWIFGYTKRIQRQARHAGGRATFFDHIYEVISFRGVTQAAAAMFVPVLTSVIAAVFGS